ncbi:hypothetical protein GWO43_22345 [candidate division KSB1 bacterium]|nr:hypothetical protein [candidate division KSB1 bacterium]NIV70716.1 hypothetical protein [Phycisphaerae bacterium]NIS26771.1 hypothetical protein [candidate division KSB1 bacterium]NIT73565.1 hypothetical protein [candidate division KSB1 bacterium]NIU27441.1 hypothetical protein [candidate division KSB1 bacterium]
MRFKSKKKVFNRGKFEAELYVELNRLLTKFADHLEFYGQLNLPDDLLYNVGLENEVTSDIYELVDSLSQRMAEAYRSNWRR